MKHILYSVVFIAALFLTGCADAGEDQEVAANQSVTLNANGSTPSAGGTITSYKWEQIQGPDVVLSNQNTTQATFTAPSVARITNVVFKLTVVETGGKISPFTTKDFIVVVIDPDGDSSDNNGTDTTKPVITLNGETNVTVNLGDTYIELGAEANDDVDGNLTSSIVIEGNVDTDVAGVYFVRYNVSDAAGNAAEEVTRVVSVVDNNGTKNIVVVSISDDTVSESKEEAPVLKHHVVLNAITTSAVDFNLSFENITTSDDDYNKTVGFDLDITLDSTGTILTVPAGLKEFDMYIQVYPDRIDEDTESYKIFLGDESAIGTIID